MADYESDQQEQRVKAWLKENGGAIVFGLVLAFGGLFGFRQWEAWQVAQQRQASSEYSVMVQYLDQENLDAAVSNFETLRADHADSPYASLAALRMARARVQAGQPDLALPLLERVMRDGRPRPVRTVARGRLARLQIDQGEPDSALATLDAAPSESGFEALFAEIRGDAHAALGNDQRAADYYRQALSQLDAGTGNRSFLELKLQSLAVTGEDDAGVES